MTWHRRAIAALCAGLAVYLLAQYLASPTRDGTPVVVLATEVAAGQRLSADDLSVAVLPPDAVPDGAYTATDALVGSALLARLPRGTPLQASLLSGSRAVAPGRSLVPISVADDRLLAVLRPGDRISLVVGTGEFAEPVSDDARVASVPGTEETASLSIGGGRGGLLLVEVPDADAAAVAMLGQSGQLGLVLAGS
ncbi:MAG TPA: SAF domain-containing protein [Arachnia sp.]|nr:SAF domain-containing protein [Arachnia sp.]HMT87607.1 SAF domain-containing protein [Arachnia sp.]